MSVRYKRKGNCSRGEWSEQELVSAVDAVKKGIMGVNQAARQYKIPCTTLRRRLRLGDTSKKSLGPHSLFGEKNERKLVEHILHLQNNGVSLTRTMIRELAFRWAEQLGIGNRFNKKSEKAGKNWMQLFLERNPDLSIQKSRGVSMSRAEIKKSVAEYFLYNDLLDGDVWTPQDIDTLISLVKIYNVIYDQSDPDYNNKDVVDNIWQDIGIKLKRAPESCSKKWQILSSEYQRKNNTLKLNKSKNKKWYFDSIDFIKDYLIDIPSGDNLSPLEESFDIKTEIEDEDITENHSDNENSNDMESCSRLDNYYPPSFVESVYMKTEVEDDYKITQTQNNQGNDSSVDISCSRIDEVDRPSFVESVYIKKEIEDENILEQQNHNGHETLNDLENCSRRENFDRPSFVESVYVKTEIEDEEFTEIPNPSGNEISSSKLNQENSENVIESYNKAKHTDNSSKRNSMELFLLGLVEDASALSKPLQTEFKLKTLALLHSLQ